MTDLIKKIARAMRAEFRKLYGKEWSGQIKPPSHTTSDLVLANAALSVIKENAGDLVRPLAWTDAQSFRNVAQGQGGIYELGKVAVGEAVMRFIPDGWDDDDELENLGHASTAEECAALKAKAQQHHTARVITLLNLEVE